MCFVMRTAAPGALLPGGFYCATGECPKRRQIAAPYWRLTSRAETVLSMLGVGPYCAIPALAMSAPRRSVVPGSIIKALIDEIHC